MPEMLVPITVLIIFAIVATELIGLAKHISNNRTARMLVKAGAEVPPSLMQPSSEKAARSRTAATLLVFAIAITAFSLLAAPGERAEMLEIAAFLTVVATGIYLIGYFLSRARLR